MAPHKPSKTRYCSSLGSPPCTGIRARDFPAGFQEIHFNSSEKKLVTMVDWSDDRIAALSDQDLKNLLVNAERKSVAAVIALCKAEMEKRDAAKPRKASKPRTA